MEDDRRAFYWLEEILADEDALQPPKAIIPHLAWRGRTSLVAAREKAGKSTLLSAGVSALSAGGSFLGQQLEPGNVLWIGLEEHISDTARNFMKFDGDPRRIAIVSRVVPSDAIEGDGQSDGLKAVCAVVQPDVIVWDSLSAFADATNSTILNPGDAAAWTRVVRTITDFCREIDAASVILHHARKSDGKYRDSTAIGANVDAILQLYGKEGSTRRTVKGVGRWDIDEIQVDLRREGYVLVGSDDDLQQKVIDFVRTNENCTWRELRNGIKAKSEDVQHARDAVLASGKIKNMGTDAAHRYQYVSLIRLKK